MEILELQDRMTETNDQARAIQARADGEKRDLTEDEAGEIETLTADFDRIEKDMLRRERLAAQQAKLAKPAGRKTDPSDPGEGTDPIGQANRAGSDGAALPRLPARAADTGKWGWRAFGEFAQAVRLGSMQGGAVDNRLRARMAPTTVTTEGTGADGGFAIPPDFRTEIAELMQAETSLASRCDSMESSSNFLSFPRDATTPWQTSGGILAYWEGEGQQLTQSKLSLEKELVPLNKLTVLVPVTEEALEDAPALGSYLRRKAPQKMNFKVDLAIVQGTGVGQPTGILNAGCLVSVAKESGQTADTLKFENVVKMWSRCYAKSRLSAVWLINQDIEPQLMTMEFTGTNSSVPAYLPANGLSGSPYGTLMGRPVIPHEACETLGDKGDILLVNLQDYLLGRKIGGIRAETSIHLWFDYDVTAFKFVLRIGGRPWWASTASPRDGSNTLSPFITLDERA